MEARLSLRRRLVTLAAVLVAAAVLPASAQAADTLRFGDEGPSASFGANAIVRIDGTITYASDCPKPGIDDFFYPATDVYVVPAGAGAGELQDAGGGRPNTIVSGASAFADEVIAMTGPAGQLDEGTYDVVYDTCQDGQFDPGRDTLFPNAVTVTLPDVLPLADRAIREIKDEARSEYVSWVATRLAMNGVFKLADQALKTQCTAGNAVGCAMRQLDYFGGVKQRFLTLLVSQANHYLAIAEDPPDENYKALTALAAIEAPKGRNDSGLGNATADALGPIAGEAALSAALLRAIERYQGAQAAGDGEWALVHARQARNLAATLRAVVPATGDALDELRNTIAARSGELDAELSRGRDFARRVWSTGFTAGERRALLNQGRSASQIADLETELRGDAFGEGSGVDSAGVLDALDDARAAHTATAAALGSASAEWDEIVTALETDDVPNEHPRIDAGGPYGAAEGAPFALEGSAGGAIDSAAWDLDGDGSFDDASGLKPSVSFAEAGAHVIGLRATKDGREALSFAVVRVAETNRAPVLSSPVPAERSATVVVGDPRTFAIDASDTDGDPVSYAWKVDGDDAGETSASFTFAPTAEQVGTHVIEVTASDGTASGGDTRRAWEVVVLARDDDDDGWTATTDCDEADPAVHPSSHELLGNGIDDDCDTGTPDGPPGGLTGSIWSWGSNHNGTVGTGSFEPAIMDAPVPIPGYDDVVGVESADRVGYAVLASGEARGWGFNGSGELGIGEFGSRSAPVSPLPVGGGPGHLSGVVQLAANGAHVVARRQDGSVVSWGENRDRQLGDGSTVNHRLFPVQVLSAADGPPLTGVKAVEAGATESFAVMEDGTVRAWGQTRCDGGVSVRVEPFPVALPLVGDDVRQISAGHQWLLILRKDGTVLSCGAHSPVSGRPPGDALVPLPVTGLGAGSGVVDVSAGYGGAHALKADGTVWAWGYNSNGSLDAAGVPEGGSAPAPIPVPLPPGPPVVDVEMDTACHTLALRADGSVLSWGCDFFGQAGDGPGPGVVSTPTVLSLPGASAYRISNSIWNSLVLTRPAADPGWERPATWIKASVADAAVGEGGGGRFTVSLSAELPHDVTVDWSLLAGTAGGPDLTLGDGTATVPAGAKTVEMDVPVLDDALDEDAETFTIVLRDASNGIRLARSQAAGTIEDDDGPPTVSVQPATVAEGDTSLTDAPLSVSLSQPSGKQVAVAFETADGSAESPGDYQATSGRLVFEPGEQEAVVHVAARGDTSVEPDETLTLTLSHPENATLGEDSATLTIDDDEPLALAVTSPTVAEADDGTTPATFTVELEPAPPAGTTVSVDYHIAGLTADVPGDVARADGTLVFGPGDEQQQVTVNVRGDRSAEPDEAFRLALTNMTATGGRVVLPGEGSIATILDDDDSTAPTTTATADPPPNEAGWNRTAVTVTLTATDDEGGSGVEELTYRLTGAQTGGETVPGAQASARITTEGATTVTYFAADKAGNTEAEKTLVVRIEKAPPPPPHDATTPQCADGVDNDGDGAVDADDAGCLSGPDDSYDPTDDNEGDEGLRELVLCGRRAISLVRADARGRSVLLSGLVASRYAGEYVAIHISGIGSARKLTSVKANTDGEFKAQVDGPSRRLFKRVRYQASVGPHRSVELKLPQSLESKSIRRRGGTITLRGQVKRSLLGKRNPVVIRRLSCGRYQKVGEARPNSRGVYVVRFPAPEAADAALYRAETEVLSRPGGSRYVRQFARAISIRVGNQTG